MANLLTIIKEPNDYFTFILNDNTVNAIKNTRNDLTTVGQFCHFKTSNGANLIKEQNILFGNITIINGGSTLIPLSIDDLFVKLISVGFFDWINGTGSGGVNRFDELDDTFQYFGKDGQVVRVNESELKLESFVLPDFSYLTKFPSPLVAGRILQVNETATAYEFVNAFNTVTQEIREGETETSPSENAIFLALQTISESIQGDVEFIDFPRLEEDQQDFIIPEGKTAIQAIVNGAVYVPSTANNTDNSHTFSQTGTTVTTQESLVTGNYISFLIQ